MFVLPDLAGLSAADLDELLVAVRDEAADIQEALSNADTADSVDIDRLDVLADYVDQLNAAKAIAEAALAARADKVAAALAKINPVVEVPVVDVEVPTEPVVAAVDEPAAPVTPEPVVAAAPVAHPAPRKVVQLAPKTKVPSDDRQVAIVAAAGVAGLRGGAVVEMGQLVKPAVSRWESYAGVTYAKDELFSLRAPERDPRLVANGHNDQDVMEYAASQARLPRLADAKPNHEGIVAAGGWCAPAEQRFDICTLAELDGILDVPTIGMPRGSISYFRQLDYSTVATAIADGQFCFTNAQLVATPPVVKPCFEIPCATPVTATLDACGLCLRAGLLQQKAFPELIAAWMHLALIAHAHFLNARNIAQMVAGSGAAIVMPTQFGAIAEVLDTLYLQATVYRAQNGMSMNAPLEVVAPYWLPILLELDQERRQFDSDADNDWRTDLAEHGIRVQFVKDFQDSAFVAADPVTVWPTSVQFLMFAPGAWVRGAEDIINVSTLVDSTLLQTNRVQLLFVEAATVMLPWCGPSKLINITGLCASGATAGPIAATPGTFACGN